MSLPRPPAGGRNLSLVPTPTVAPPTDTSRDESKSRISRARECREGHTRTTTTTTQSPSRGGSLSSSNAAHAMATAHTRSPSPSTHSNMHSHTAGAQQHQTTLVDSVTAAAAAPPNGQSTFIAYDNTKAGLQNVDRAKTEAFIKELSEGSYFYLNEQRKAQARERKVGEMLAKAKLFEANIVKGNSRKYAEISKAVDDREKELRTYGYLHGIMQEKVFVFLDMDQFYAACEEKKNPDLKLRPLGVGSNAMLSTTNYVARQYGVRSGMPGFIGKKLCPSLVITPCDYALYKQESKAVRAVVAEYDPNYTALGWDELTMELSGYLDRHVFAQPSKHSQDEESPSCSAHEATTADGVQNGGAEKEVRRRSYPTMEEKFDAVEKVVAELRAKITAATQLTASAGIALTSTLAKIASNYNKPNGQHSLRLFTREAIMDFMHGLNCRQVPGIGKSQEHILNGLGMKTVGDLYANRVLLSHLITPKTFQFLLSTSLGVGGMFEDIREEKAASDGQRGMSSANTGDDNGEDDSEDGAECMDEWGRKSIGQERTFYRLKSAMELETIARQNLLDALKGMRAEERLAGRMVLKLKHVNFHVKQYSRTIVPYTDEEETLQHALNSLMTPIASCYADYRLLGVRLEKLIRKGQWVAEQAHTTSKEGGGGPQQPTLLELMSRKRSRPAANQGSRSPSSCFPISDEDDDEVVILEKEAEVDEHDDAIAKQPSSASVVEVHPTPEEMNEADSTDDVVIIE